MGGCSLAPEQAADEVARVNAEGVRYEPEVAERSLPELPERPHWKDVLARALLANGDLEAAYFAWRGAVERIGIASAYPNTNVGLGFSTIVSSGGMKGFDATTFNLGFDGMENLSFPGKVKQQGKIAFDLARSAGERFRAAKFELQKRVLVAWADYGLLAERLRIQRDALELARITMDTSHAKVRAGGAQQDVLTAEVAYRVADDRVRSSEAALDAVRAGLNGLLARPADTDLVPPSVEPPRELVADDAMLLAAAVEKNPELAALAHEVEGRTDALALARMQWIPDVNPSALITSGGLEALGAAIILPTTIDEIRGGIREAEAMLRESEAMLRQSQHARAGEFVATLVALRDAERQTALFETQILPLAGTVSSIVRQGYVNGASSYRDLIDAERSRLDAEVVLAETRAAREKRLAEIEALMGVDVETLASSARDGHASKTLIHDETADGVERGGSP
ncbi:MAG: TolC family protein [Planctomycetes bacterium]|nr:TolC family protein [Planctomycetota bacterium]MCC7172741.1 TolC family protein [Planctomycetota bacterium]